MKWKINQRPTESERTLTVRINHNRSTALERPVINYLGGGGLNCVKYFYSSVNQNSEHINQDSSLRWNKMNTQQQDRTLEQQKSNRWTPVGPTKDRTSSPSQLNWKLYAAAIIKSEARPAGVQLKRVAKLLTVTGLTTKHAVCRITFMLYPILL